MALTEAGNDFVGRVDIDARDAPHGPQRLALGRFTLTGDLALESHGDLDLDPGKSDVGGRLVAHSGGGNATQSGALVAGRGIDIDAGGGHVAL